LSESFKAIALLFCELFKKMLRA